jgi:hypothetical protein
MHSQYGGKDLLPLQLCGHMLKTLSVLHRLSLEETSPVAFDLKQLSMQHTLRTCELDKDSGDVVSSVFVPANLKMCELDKGSYHIIVAGFVPVLEGTKIPCRSRVAGHEGDSSDWNACL